MVKHLSLIWSFSLLFLLSATVCGQDKAPALSEDALKTSREAIAKLDWFPKPSRDTLTQVQNALALSDRAKQSDDLPEAYATIMEALNRSNAAEEWYLSRDLIREADARFELPPETLKTWYANAIKQTKTGARLAELVNILAADVSGTDLRVDARKAIHKQLANRLNNKKFSQTQFFSNAKTEQIGQRIELQGKSSDSWQGIALIVEKNQIQEGLEKLAKVQDASVSAAASAALGNDFSFPAFEKLIQALIAKDHPNTQEAAIRIFQSILKELTVQQIIELQEICYAFDHSLHSDYSMPYYNHDQAPGQASRMKVESAKPDSRQIKFNEADSSFSIIGDCVLNYQQMPLTSFVHDIEFSAETIPRFFKFRYGAHNSLRVGFENAGEDRIRLKHQHSYGRKAKSKTSRSTFETGARIRLRVYTICGRQFVVINGKSQTNRHIDNVWTSHQLFAEPDTKLTVYKSTLRNWVPSDAELFLRTVGDTEGWLRCIAKPSSPLWNRDELIKFVNENSRHKRKPAVGQDFVNYVGLSMAPISAGQFKHGNMTLKLSEKFWVSRHEISQLQWEEVMHSNPASIQGNAYFPVDNVSYKEAITFCRRLNTAAKKKNELPKGYGYRLLTEAEWEYVCRAGSTEVFSIPTDKFWHRAVSQPRYQTIGTSAANAFGLYDMHGNVEEFTLDKYVEIPDSSGVQVNPMNPADNKNDHVSIRGGSWCTHVSRCQSDRRKTGLMENCPYRGLRVALAPITDK